MNAKFLEHVKSSAVQVVAQKIADGQIDPATASFEELVKQFEEEVLKLATSFGVKQPDAEPVKPQRKNRNPAVKVDGVSKGGSVTPEQISEYLFENHKSTLLSISDHFKVSKGVAERAVKALGDKVKSEVGAPEPGKRGKPPTVYSLAE